MALVPSLYRQYSTKLKPGFDGAAPGITSRFEVFTDDTFAEMKVSILDIEFEVLLLTAHRSIHVGYSSHHLRTMLLSI